MDSYIIYCARNRLTGDEYVGLTKQRLNDRRLKHYSEAERGAPRCRHFGAAIRKYGRDAFEWSVLLDGLTADEALTSEARIIAERSSAYNILPGGSGFYRGHKKTPEHIAKVSAALRGQKRTPEQIERFRKVRADPAYRANHSAKLKGRKHSAERIAAMMAGRAPDMNFKAVKCVEDRLVFQSQKDAAAHYGVARNSICHALKKPTNTIAGKHFVRVKEY